MVCVRRVIAGLISRVSNVPLKTKAKASSPIAAKLGRFVASCTSVHQTLKAPLVRNVRPMTNVPALVSFVLQEVVTLLQAEPLVRPQANVPQMSAVIWRPFCACRIEAVVPIVKITPKSAVKTVMCAILKPPVVSSKAVRNAHPKQ
jgi:hypothetical protein